jgi:hypothetical protein
MGVRHRDIFRAIGVFTVLCVAQVYLLGGASARAANDAPLLDPHPQTGGTLKTTNNQPIIVNGNSVRPGTTILSGSNIQTPAGVGATIEFGSATVCIAPNSSLVLEFTASTATVTLKTGCAILTPHGNATGTITTPDGTSTESKNGQSSDVCFAPNATAPVVNQGAAVNAGACAGAGTFVPSSSGVNRTLVAVLIAGAGFGTLAAILLAGGGSNPSPSTP